MSGPRPGAVRPKAVAFDIIGTVFSLEPLRAALVGLGLPAASAEFLYTATLRDTFALAATDGFAPFRAVMAGCLDEVLAREGVAASAADKQAALGRMASLPPHDDAGAAFAVLAEAGIRVFALSNGAAQTTQGLFDEAGLGERIERVLSVEQVGLSKPRPEVYRFAAETAGVAPGEMALVATHPGTSTVPRRPASLAPTWRGGCRSRRCCGHRTSPAKPCWKPPRNWRPFPIPKASSRKVASGFRGKTML